MNNILSAMEKRSSTRGYTAEKLTETELESLLKAAAGPYRGEQAGDPHLRRGR